MKSIPYAAPYCLLCSFPYCISHGTSYKNIKKYMLQGYGALPSWWNSAGTEQFLSDICGISSRKEVQ